MVAFFVGFLLSVAPIPYLTTDSITQETILLIMAPSPCCFPHVTPGEWFAAYLYVATLVSLALSQPVHIYQGLALFGPPEAAMWRRARLTSALQLNAAFLVGLVVAWLFVLPIAITVLRSFDMNDLPGQRIGWTLPEYVVTVAGLIYLFGIGVQMLVWPTVLVRLEVTTQRALRRFRRYLLLATVIVAALATPSTDLLSLMLVAVPLYLFYEAGLSVVRWRHTIRAESPTTPALSQESDSLSDEFRWRGSVCLSALGIGFLVAIVPLPISLAQVVERVLTLAAEGHLVRFRLGESWSMLFVGSMLAVLFAQPVVLWQLLDALTPAEMVNRSWRLAVTTLAALVSCAVGVLVAYWLLLPRVIESQLVFGLAHVIGGLETKWAYSEYVETTARFMLGIGLASEIPAIIFGLVWLGVASRDRLASWRKYAVLIAAVAAAWVTPTGDPLNQLFCALPIYGLFELGLRIASRASINGVGPPADGAALRQALREAPWRVTVCVAAVFVMVMLTHDRIPAIAEWAFDHQIGRLTILPREDSKPFIDPQVGLQTYAQLATLSAFALVQPALIYHALALAVIRSRRSTRWRRALASTGLTIMFWAGLVVGYSLYPPPRFGILPSGEQLFPGPMSASPVVATLLTRLFVFGVALQIPIWPAVLVGLGAVRLSVLYWLRPFVALTMVLGALLTTPRFDVLPPLVIGLLLYLLFELGLLVARFLPSWAVMPRSGPSVTVPTG